MIFDWADVARVQELLRLHTTKRDVLLALGYKDTTGASLNKLNSMIRIHDLDTSNLSVVSTNRSEQSKRCKTCKQHKSTSEYHSNGLTKNGSQKYKPNCKPCELEHLNKRKREILDSIVELKCAHCGYDACYAALDFHHIDAVDKEFGIAYSHFRNKKKLIAELLKCAILCSRCHREHHAGMFEVPESYRIKIKV